MVSLVVRDASTEDYFNDIIRIHADNRPGSKAGHVIVVKANGAKVRGIARGGAATDEVFLSGDAQLKLSLARNSVNHIEICSGNLLSEVYWAWRASDPTARIAARLAVLSVVLGALGVVLGFLA
jgi:hypothetical protein